jgi:hypothetical protein
MIIVEDKILLESLDLLLNKQLLKLMHRIPFFHYLENLTIDSTSCLTINVFEFV